MTAPAQLPTGSARGDRPRSGRMTILRPVSLHTAPPAVVPPPRSSPMPSRASLPDAGRRTAAEGPARLRPSVPRPSVPRPSVPRPLVPRSEVLRPARTRHLVLAVVTTLAVVAGLGWLGLTAGDGAAVPAETAVVRVGAGETVWDVAARVAPGSDPRLVVQRIRELNGMTGSAVQPGQQLQVPDGR